jgi:hypothetical protein
MVSILMNELDNSARLKTADVLFQIFTSVRVGNFKEENTSFHKLVTDLLKLGVRRNEIVHSLYYNWITEHGESGLIRQTQNYVLVKVNAKNLRRSCFLKIS